MVILGIDPGIADTGFGVIEDLNGRLKVLTFGSIKTKANLPLGERLAELYDQLGQLIKQYKPQTAAIEQLFFCNNAKTALIVGQARGVAMLCCQQAGLHILEFTPLQVKQAVAAYGGADKKQVQRMVQVILGLKEIPKPDDAADALALAVCGLNNANFLAKKELKKH